MAVVMASPVCALSPQELIVSLEAVSYTPKLLLSSGIDPTLTADIEFQKAAQAGFEVYFEDMYQHNPVTHEFVFVPYVHTQTEVLHFLLENVWEERASLPLAWCIGCAVGWLSALALTTSPHAWTGIQFLHQLLTLIQIEHVNKNAQLR